MRYIAERDDLKGPLPLVTALARNVNGKQQRIVVTADADMRSNGEMDKGAGAG
jgi:ABC-2 type transport system permease protein